jgi:hypothetical protein
MAGEHCSCQVVEDWDSARMGEWMRVVAAPLSQPQLDLWMWPNEYYFFTLHATVPLKVMSRRPCMVLETLEGRPGIL